MFLFAIYSPGVCGVRAVWGYRYGAICFSFFFLFSLALSYKQTLVTPLAFYLTFICALFFYLGLCICIYLMGFFLYTLSSSSFVVILLSYLFSCINVLRSGCWPSQAFLFSSLQPSSSPTSPFLPHCVFPSQAPGSMVT